jgi:ribosome-binding protein aMBF1 (putative translation factor)
MHTHNVILDGREYVMVPRAQWERLQTTRSSKREYTLDDVRQSLAAKMVRRRESAGLTQAELARRAGVRQETISRLENSQHMPSPRTFDKLDRILSEAEASRSARA